MKRYQTILFDLDGTLLNSLEDLKDSVNEILKRHNYPVRNLEEIRTFVGNGAFHLIQCSLPKGCQEKEVRDCLKEYSDYYFRHSQIKTCPYKGIPELLKELQKKGILVGVVSNKGEETVKDLCKNYFPGYISAAVGGKEGFQKKPAPDNVIRAIRKLKGDKGTTLYVGDSEVDIKTAENCHLDSVLVTWGFRTKKLLLEHGAKVLIDSPLELLQYLESRSL